MPATIEATKTRFAAPTSSPAGFAPLAGTTVSAPTAVSLVLAGNGEATQLAVGATPKAGIDMRKTTGTAPTVAIDAATKSEPVESSNATNAAVDIPAGEFSALQLGTSLAVAPAAAKKMPASVAA